MTIELFSAKDLEAARHAIELRKEIQKMYESEPSGNEVEALMYGEKLNEIQEALRDHEKGEYRLLQQLVVFHYEMERLTLGDRFATENEMENVRDDPFGMLPDFDIAVEALRLLLNPPVIEPEPIEEPKPLAPAESLLAYEECMPTVSDVVSYEEHEAELRRQDVELERSAMDEQARL